MRSPGWPRRGGRISPGAGASKSVSETERVSMPNKPSRLAATCGVLILASVVSGCASGPTNDCAWVEPIHTSSESVEAMSDETVQAVLEHNEAWSEVCGDE